MEIKYRIQFTFLVIFSFVTLFSCVAQNEGSIAFDIIRDHNKVKLPDSLKSEGIKGTAIIKIYVDNDLKIQSLDIKKLKVLNYKEELISYVHEDISVIPFEEYPEPVKRYYPFLVEYANNLDIKPSSTKRTNVSNQGIILVEFN